jgi:hypothetical protein
VQPPTQNIAHSPLLSPRPVTSQPAQQRTPSPSNVSSGRARPTDTFSLPFPDGYYQMEFPINLPAAYPSLVSDSLRYTAVPCSYEEFADRKPLNRQPFNLKFKQAKMVVVLTMYNEDIDLFALTLEAVYKNIEFMIDKYKNKDAAAASTTANTATPIPSGTVSPYEQLNSVETGSSHSSIAWDDVVVVNYHLKLTNRLSLLMAVKNAPRTSRLL